MNDQLRSELPQLEHYIQYLANQRRKKDTVNDRQKNWGRITYWCDGAQIEKIQKSCTKNLGFQCQRFSLKDNLLTDLWLTQILQV